MPAVVHMQLEANTRTLFVLKVAAVIAGAVLLTTFIMAVYSMAPGSITAKNLDAGSVTTTQLATGAVEAADLASSAVVEDKLGAGSVTGSKVAAGSITDANLASGAAVERVIGLGAVSTGELVCATTGNEFVPRVIYAFVCPLPMQLVWRMRR